jgi:uncharacterized protein YneF (UPF0154 family)
VIIIINGIIENMMNAIREILIGAIISQAQGLFDTVNEELLNASDRLSETPMEFAGGGPWGMVEGIAGTAGTVVQVIAGLILGFFIALELVQMLVEKNNFADIDMISVILKWIVKSFIAIMIVSNAFVIVGAIFTIGSDIITDAAIDAVAGIGAGPNITELEENLEDVGLGTLVGILFQLFILNLFFPIVRIVIFVVTVGRFMEIFMYIAAAPIPLATMANQEYRAMGNNYLKALAAIAFQGLLMIVSIAVVGALMVDAVAGIGAGADVGVGLFSVLGYLILMCFALMKAPAVSKSIFNAQ